MWASVAKSASFCASFLFSFSYSLTHSIVFTRNWYISLFGVRFNWTCVPVHCVFWSKCVFLLFYFFGLLFPAFTANRFFLQCTRHFASLSLFIICYIGNLNLNWWVQIRCFILLLFAIAVSLLISTQPHFLTYFLFFHGISFIFCSFWLLWLLPIVCPILFAIAPLTDAINYPKKKKAKKFKLLSFCCHTIDWQRCWSE